MRTGSEAKQHVKESLLYCVLSLRPRHTLIRIRQRKRSPMTINGIAHRNQR